MQFATFLRPPLEYMQMRDFCSFSRVFPVNEIPVCFFFVFEIPAFQMGPKGVASTDDANLSV
jgi:hypothetical protein